MNKIDQFLKKDKVQRLSYAALLVCWIFIFLHTDTRSYVTSYAEYLPLIFIVPVILFVLQILFNNSLLWLIILACSVLYTLWKFFKTCMYVVTDHHSGQYNDIEWNVATIFLFGCIICIFIMINWLIFKLRPNMK